MNVYDLVYWAGGVAASPVWLANQSSRQKVIRALRERMGDVPTRDTSQPAVMIHAVSLGEMNATRALVAMLREQKPGLRFIISATTETGFARADELYSKCDDITLIRYPLDFSKAIGLMLDRLKPALVVLMELEVWPNFVRLCERRGVPVMLINGRITEGSFRKYRTVRPLLGGMFSRLTRVCAQDELYADRFKQLGAPADRVSITGTMKFDNAAVAHHIAGQEELAAAVGLAEAKQVWVCGSTGPGEEQLLLSVYREIRSSAPHLRLVIVPRKPERFDEVAQLIDSVGLPVFRRSRPEMNDSLRLPYCVVLGDTIGELKKFYALAEVVFCGRSLVDLGSKQHGSDMIEPAALGKPTIVGPYTGNFADAMRCFIASGAICVVNDAATLTAALKDVLANPEAAKQMGARAQQVVAREQGATARHVKVILEELGKIPAKN